MQFKYLIILLMTSGCVYMPSKVVRSINEVENRDVTECQLIGQVHGESEFSYLTLGVQIAKDRAKKEAAHIGATDVVWTEIDSGIRPLAIGKAYYCLNVKG